MRLLLPFPGFYVIPAARPSPAYRQECPAPAGSAPYSFRSRCRPQAAFLPARPSDGAAARRPYHGSPRRRLRPDTHCMRTKAPEYPTPAGSCRSNTGSRYRGPQSLAKQTADLGKAGRFFLAQTGVQVRRAEVLFGLPHVRHSAQHNGHTGKAHHKPQCPGGGGKFGAGKIRQTFFGKVGEHTAVYRLHHHDGDTPLSQNFVLLFCSPLVPVIIVSSSMIKIIFDMASTSKE